MVAELQSLPPLRTRNQGFPGERQNFKKGVERGTLPKGVLDYKHQLPWPVINMAAEPTHIMTHHCQWLRVHHHVGIDIQCQPGTKIQTVQSGYVVSVSRGEAENGSVWVYNPESGIVTEYVHLHRKSIAPEMRKIMDMEPDPRDLEGIALKMFRLIE